MGRVEGEIVAARKNCVFLPPQHFVSKSHECVGIFLCSLQDDTLSSLSDIECFGFCQPNAVSDIECLASEFGVLGSILSFDRWSGRVWYNCMILIATGEDGLRMDEGTRQSMTIC